MRKEKAKENGQTGKGTPLPTPTEADGILSLRHFFFAGNVPLLELCISLPLPTGEGRGAKRIAAFYRELAKNAIAHAGEALIPALWKAYEADPDPRKRFRHRPARLSLRGRVTEESECYFSLVRESHLIVAQGETARREAEIFSVKSGRLCPPAYLRQKGIPLAPPAVGGVTAEPQKKGVPPAPRQRKKRPPQASERRAGKGYFLENGMLHIFTDKIRIF